MCLCVCSLLSSVLLAKFEKCVFFYPSFTNSPGLGNYKHSDIFIMRGTWAGLTEGHTLQPVEQRHRWVLTNLAEKPFPPCPPLWASCLAASCRPSRASLPAVLPAASPPKHAQGTANLSVFQKRTQSNPTVNYAQKRKTKVNSTGLPSVSSVAGNRSSITSGLHSNEIAFSLEYYTHLHA